MNKTSVCLAVICAVMLSPLAAHAQKPEGPITWIAFSKVKSGKMQQAVELVLDDSDWVDELMKQGTIMTWGVATPINHFPDSNWNFVQWVTVADWAKVDDWAKATFAHMASIEPKQQKQMEERHKAIFVDGSHWDRVVRNVVWNPGEPGQGFRYLLIDNRKVKPGMEQEMVGLFNDFVAPVASKLQQEGTLTGFGLHAKELHDGSDEDLIAWYALPGLEAIDAFDAAMAEASTPGNVARMKAGLAPDMHSDQILMVLHLGGMPTEK